MIPAETLAAINAGFNASSAVCIGAAFVAIKRGNVSWHWKLMTSAIILSGLFLVGYLTRMLIYGSKHFDGEGALRAVYLVILFSHMFLAMAVVPLVATAVVFAVRKRIQSHRRLVKFAYPVWAYVSVTGVVVYGMLYHLSV